MAWIDRQVGLAVAATAAAMSPEVRHAVRRGAVIGLAETLRAGDVVASTARAAARGAKSAAAPSDGGDRHPARTGAAS